MKRAWLFKSLGILMSIAVVITLIVSSVSAAPVQLKPVVLQGYNVATPPTVTTQTASSLTVNKAGTTSGKFNGTLTSAGSGDTSYVQVWFQYDTTDSYGTNTAKIYIKTPAAFTSMLPKNLIVGTTYHYRAATEFKDAGGGPTYGEDQTFTFTAPTVTSGAATAAMNSKTGAISAIFHGIVSGLGSASNVYTFFEYGLTDGYGFATPLIAKTTTGAFAITGLTNMASGTTYHYRADLKIGTTVIHGGDESLTFGTSGRDIITANLTDSGLTSGRIPFASRGGLLSDDAGLTWGSDILTAPTISATTIGATTGNITTVNATTVVATTLNAPTGRTTCYVIAGYDSPPEWKAQANATATSAPIDGLIQDAINTMYTAGASYDTYGTILIAPTALSTITHKIITPDMSASYTQPRLTIEGSGCNGATVLSLAANCDMFGNSAGFSFVTFRNMMVIGNNRAYSFWNGNGQEPLFENMRFYQFKKAGIYQQKVDGRMVVNNCFFTYCGDIGVSDSGGILLGEQTPGASNSGDHIRNTQFNGNSKDIKGVGEVYVGTVDIEGCVFADIVLAGVEFDCANDISMIGNQFFITTSGGMALNITNANYAVQKSITDIQFNDNRIYMSVDSTAPLIRIYPRNNPRCIQINNNLIDVNYHILPEIIYMEDMGNVVGVLSIQNNLIRAVGATIANGFINADFIYNRVYDYHINGNTQDASDGVRLTYLNIPANGEVMTYTGTLAGVTPAGIMASIVNPFECNVRVLSVDIEVKTQGAASGTMCVGIGSSPTTDYETIFHVLPCDNGTSYPYFFNSHYTATYGVQTNPIYWAYGGGNQYLNFYAHVANAGYVATYTITVMGSNPF